MQKDPSNRASGNTAAIAWGAELFRDPRLSGNGTLACASCHQAEKSFTDGLPKARGLVAVDRNTPSVANTRLQRWYGWDGAGDSLWAQSLRPMVDPREMGSDVTRVAAAVRGNADLASGYRKAFGAASPADDEALAVDVAKALAAFQETIETGRTPFDDFRDALSRGDRTAAARYPPAAQRGLRIFIGKGQCNVCHIGPGFSNGEFHDVGIPHFAAPGRVDGGRYEGIQKLRAKPLQPARSLQRRPDAKHGNEHPPRRARRIGTSANSRFRRCATWHALRRTCTTAALPRWRTWSGTIPKSTRIASMRTASGS